jgi:hypothetical protein
VQRFFINFDSVASVSCRSLRLSGTTVSSAQVAGFTWPPQRQEVGRKMGAKPRLFEHKSRDGW